MDVAAAAMGSLLRKLAEPLNEESRLQKSVREDVEYISREMKRTKAFLLKAAEVPWDQRNERFELLVGNTRELSYSTEDIMDDLSFHLRPEGSKKMCNLFKGKTRRQIITDLIKRMKALLQEIVDLNDRYGVYDVANPAAMKSSDPRLLPLYVDVRDLVGIDGKKDQELMKLLLNGDNVPNKKLKILSVVGFGGLGKTTLVKRVYDKIKRGFNFNAFIRVGPYSTAKNVFIDIIISLETPESRPHKLDASQLIQKVQGILEDKRYLIVIDDIWNENLWEDIKDAFSNENNLGSRIITTTRILSVSKACCSSAGDSIYQIEPLSDDDSKKLFNERTFPSESGCPHEFEQVSRDILKKCGGLPLAIITIASLLNGGPKMKTKDEWHALLKSIGHKNMEDSNMENMHKILSFSYYLLPWYLKTCLLYLSIFPGSHTIGRDRLVKKWIAEGIVTQETKLNGSCNQTEAKLSQELSLEEVASQYLDELVNRNVIQPLECNNSPEVITYHIHPMMHHVLKVIAIEKKFAVSLDDKDISSAHRMNSPHLSIDCPDSENPIDSSSMAIHGDVRSLTVFGHAKQFLLRHFKGILVLDLEGCKSIETADLECICSMVRLKQLCLAKTHITELPPRIGKLQYLEGLDVGGTQITQLPTQIGKLQHLKTLDARKSRVKDLPDQVVRLTRLVHLLIGDNESCEGVKLPDGIGKMTSLQRLCTIDLRKCSASSLKDLSELPYLKEIAVVSSDELKDTRMNNALLSSLEKSTKLRSLVVYSDFRLRTLQSSTLYNLNFQKKLTVVRRSLKVPTGLANCYVGMLDIRVCKLEEDDLKILRELPRLQSLTVRLEVLPTEMIHISSEGFAKLESFYVDCRMPRVIFEEGAMPKLEHLELKLYAGSASEEHMGINHLLNLQKVTLRYSKWYATNKGVKETTDAMKTEAKEHQNKGVEETTDAVKTEAKEHQKKGVKETTDAVKTDAKEHQNKGIKETTDAMKTEAKEHQNKIILYIVEEGKDGKCTMKTEIFPENKDASCSKMTATEEEDGLADGTGYFLNGGDNRQEGDLHQSSRDIASCNGTNEIEEVE